MGMELVNIPCGNGGCQVESYRSPSANEKKLNEISKMCAEIFKIYNGMGEWLNSPFSKICQKIDEGIKKNEEALKENQKNIEEIERLVAKMKQDDIALNAKIKAYKDAEDARFDAEMRAEKDAKAQSAKNPPKWIDRHPNFKAALPYLVIAAIVAMICIPVIIVCCLI